jgi:hypothetical protein
MQIWRLIRFINSLFYNCLRPLAYSFGGGTTHKSLFMINGDRINDSLLAFNFLC